ncbi:MAG: hypothetical protein JSR18_05895 [Proteobacteria bacterium]|nr:hypothetical protein [Pseudomonadota bacterium]
MPRDKDDAHGRSLVDAAVDALAGPPPTDAASLPPDDPARRKFIQVSAAVAGSSLLTACIGQDTYDVPALAGEDPLSTFDHLVCVMFENRSLDNLLGYCYPAGAGFNGLADQTYTNPVPSFITDGHTTVAAAPSPGTDADMQNPNPDPGEPYPHVNTQLFGSVNPPGNAYVDAAQMLPPYNAPAAGTTPTMQGFVEDYCIAFRYKNGRDPTYAEYRVIMDAFTPSQLPVLNTLAQSFAVYDAWYCGAPTQTYPNRSFFHASTSSGFVLNAPYSKWLESNGAPTLFNRLEDAGRTWCIYYDTTQLVPLTGLIHAIPLAPYFKTHFGSMQDFYADVAAGTLPDYAFIEPRMLFNHNDFHPPGPLVVDHVSIPDPSDVRCGDLLIHQIYSAVKASASTTGSNADNTLLLITFDEHGGTFDHVPPPSGVTPDILQPAGEMDFTFDRLGCRVPSIVISARTRAGTIVTNPAHHGTVIKTLCEKYTLQHLTERDRNAPTLADAINLATPRPASTWPVTVPPPQPPGSDNLDASMPPLSLVPLNELERHIVGIAMAYFTGVEPTDATIPRTAGEAYALLKPLVGDTFGRAR